MAEIRIGPAQGNPRCSFCHDDIGEAIHRSCTRCRALTHAECAARCLNPSCGGELGELQILDCGQGTPRWLEAALVALVAFLVGAPLSLALLEKHGATAGAIPFMLALVAFVAVVLGIGHRPALRTRGIFHGESCLEDELLIRMETQRGQRGAPPDPAPPTPDIN